MIVREMKETAKNTSDRQKTRIRTLLVLLPLCYLNLQHQIEVIYEYGFQQIMDDGFYMVGWPRFFIDFDEWTAWDSLFDVLVWSLAVYGWVALTNSIHREASVSLVAVYLFVCCVVAFAIIESAEPGLRDYHADYQQNRLDDLPFVAVAAATSFGFSSLLSRIARKPLYLLGNRLPSFKTWTIRCWKNTNKWIRLSVVVLAVCRLNFSWFIDDILSYGFTQALEIEPISGWPRDLVDSYGFASSFVLDVSIWFAVVFGWMAISLAWSQCVRVDAVSAFLFYPCLIIFCVMEPSLRNYYDHLTMYRLEDLSFTIACIGISAAVMIVIRRIGRLLK